MEKELHLDYCDICMQMTNHLDDECQKCKVKEKKTSIDAIDYKIKNDIQSRNTN